MPIDTKRASRRTLQLANVAAINRELDELAAAHDQGALRVLGNWTAGQIMQHVGDLIRYSYDGFPFTAPLPIRLFGRLIKKSAMGEKPIPAGLKLRGESAALLPPEGVTFENGLAALRAQLARIDAGEQMTQPSPIFGPMTHAQWLSLHHKHAALHLSFLNTQLS